MGHDYSQVLDFWFKDIDPKQWWVKDPEFDAHICRRFSDVHGAASCGELSVWRTHPGGRLAEIIVLDQFSRNIYRDEAGAFAFDGMALILAQEAVRAGVDRELAEAQRPFLYMPYMHSESAAIHEDALVLFNTLENESNLRFELRHKAIIDRFGRYPHRNLVLGRESTPEEDKFLAEPGSSF
jgi:uncharacterized protein (DUF924 family)